MPRNVLITGGTGLIGSRLTQMLIQQHYQVAWLSRGKQQSAGVKVYQWDVEKGYIAEEALRETDHIIHLAGAGVADKRWTKARKQEILESRTHPTRLLFEKLQQVPNSVKTFISASAIGIYGANRGDELLTENSTFGSDFLARVTQAWEAGVQPVQTLGIRTAILRIGIVLSKSGGALEKMTQPIRAGIGAPLGSGNQWISWIHEDDLCRMFRFGLENEAMQGVYNAVAPEPASNEELTREAARLLGKPVLPINVPAFALKLAVGELATAVLGSAKVSGQKIAATGFRFEYPELSRALRNLLIS